VVLSAAAWLARVVTSGLGGRGEVEGLVLRAMEWFRAKVATPEFVGTLEDEA
jgi:hypothetical protein